MNRLNIADNIVSLRHRKGITQDELATFLNVTKASVSKWETRQSYPDILLLPQISAYFGVSIDELLGYEPQLSPEQIRKRYAELADEFAARPFDEVLEKSRQTVKEYYSCYPLLIQMAILWLNHFMLTPDQDKQKEVLRECVALCEHVCGNSGDVGLSSCALAVKAAANLLLGNPQAVIEELEPFFDTKRLMLQSEPVLIQAFWMTGDKEKAELYSQIFAYMHLLSLVTAGIGMLGFSIADMKTCEVTLKRLEAVVEAYDIEHLNPNLALQLHYQAAAVYSVNGRPEAALGELEKFVNGSLDFLKGELTLQGDAYFYRLDEWFQTLPLKNEAPRNKKVVLDSLLPAIENPVFSGLFENEAYKRLKIRLENSKGGNQ